ncbi:MAG: NTP transferase domain-containing protein [Proteobacteria bacterium]|nr:NTP transferase domain-containing protein [Pseudomonadota bacterium]
MEFTRKNVAVIILAAGKGTRMKSDKAKVLHELNGRPMIGFVVDVAKTVAGDNVVVVVGHQRELVEKEVLKSANTRFAVQREQKGTGHAVMCALPEIPSHVTSVIILCGDVPLIRVETIHDLLGQHAKEDAAVTVLGVKVDVPTGYGRLIVGPDGSVIKIVEQADATDAEKKIQLINAGIYCIETDFLKDALNRITNDNAQGELYLTDIIEIAHRDQKKIGMCVCASEAEVIGVNTCDDLNKAQALMPSK